MVIYIPTWNYNIDDEDNPFVYTLVDGLKLLDDNLEFHFGYEFFWAEACTKIDLIHVMWPDILAFCNNYAVEEISNRLLTLKYNGIKIVSTCHNFEPHYSDDSRVIEIYNEVYRLSDVIIHLGNHSKIEFEKRYPNISNILIPHHVYDRLYTTVPSRKDSLLKLGLSSSKRYILTLGAFRDDEERQLLMIIGKSLRWTNTYILAPKFCSYSYDEVMTSMSLQDRINWYKLKYLYHIISYGKYVNNEDVPFYYGVSDVSFIQRRRILNSGNVPLGLLMGNVVVGPDVGNIGELLKDLRNPIFDAYNVKSAICAVKEAMRLAKQNLGRINRDYALIHFNTNRIAKMHYECYKSLKYSTKNI